MHRACWRYWHVFDVPLANVTSFHKIFCTPNRSALSTHEDNVFSRTIVFNISSISIIVTQSYLFLEKWIFNVVNRETKHQITTKSTIRLRGAPNVLVTTLIGIVVISFASSRFYRSTQDELRETGLWCIFVIYHCIEKLLQTKFHHLVRCIQCWENFRFEVIF